MQHVLVETNWVFGFAAPAHHKDNDAVELLERARRGELRLHLPSLCLSEVRNPLTTRCRPRNEARAIRNFLKWSRDSSKLTAEDYQTTDRLLNRFEASLESELDLLPNTLAALRTEANLEVFALNDAMLAMAVELAFSDLLFQPFDQSILAGVLVRARELWDSGERDLSFCELDEDLRPLDRYHTVRPPLEKLYRDSGIWVYKDFTMSAPVRPVGWPANPPASGSSI